MSNAPQPQPQSKFTRYSPALIGAGILVMALGFGLPMLTSGLGPDPQPLPNAPIDPTSKQPNGKQAAASATPAPIQPPDATGLGASLLRLVIGLAVVCGLCVLLARWFGQKPITTPGAMEVVASIPVARCVIHLVRAGERRLLIGTDLGGVKAILELPGTEPELPAEVAASEAPAEDTLASPAGPVTKDEILKLLLQLRTRTDTK